MLNIKHIADATEGTSTDDILTQDNTKTDTSYPLLPVSTQAMEIVSVSQERNSKDTGDNVVVKMKTTIENRAPGSGDVLHPGFPCTTWISITPTEPYTASMIKKNVATFTQAAGVPAVKPFDQWPGKVVDVAVGIRPGRDGAQQNTFRFVPLKKK